MDINKNNCEAFFLDYYEGNLSALEKAELLLFLEQNLELKEVFESFENITLADANELLFSGKEGLKKSILFGRYKNQDELLIDALEGNLSKEEKAQFELLLNNDFALNTEYELYKKTKLIPETISYKEKNSLKRNKIVPLYYYVSAAASIFIIFGFYLFFENNRHEKQMLVISNNIKKEMVEYNKITLASMQPKRVEQTVSYFQKDRLISKKNTRFTKKGAEQFKSQERNMNNNVVLYNVLQNDSILAEVNKVKQLFGKQNENTCLEFLLKRYGYSENYITTEH